MIKRLVRVLVVSPWEVTLNLLLQDLYTEIGANAQQWDIFRNTVALIESGGKYDIFGGSGDHYDGSVQMGQTITEEEALYIKQQHIKEHRDDPLQSEVLEQHIEQILNFQKQYLQHLLLQIIDI